MQTPGKNETVAEYLFGCYGFIQTSTIVLKREDVARIQFDTRYIRHQDYDFCIRADRLGYEFVMIARPLATYHLITKFGSKHKGESVKYSLFWLDAMKPHLTARYFFLTNKDNQAYFLNRLKDKLPSRLGGEKAVS